jgi:hypothetical protein
MLLHLFGMPNQGRARGAKRVDIYTRPAYKQAASWI